MKPLPTLLRRSPSLLYGAAAIYFVASVAFTIYQVKMVQAPYAYDLDEPLRAMIIEGVLRAAIDSIFLAANGALFHILLAFWDRFGGDAGREDGE